MSARHIHPIIRQVINRDCHVGESNRAVVRHVISKLAKGYESYRQLSAKDRCLFIEQCIAQHQANQRLYVDVMNGFPTCRKTERELMKHFESVSADELLVLMLENNVTVDYLAFRLGWSKGRVQATCQNGLSKPRDIQQWLTTIAETEYSDVPAKSSVRDGSPAADCNFCGCPMSIGDQVFEYQQNVYCSNHCCRKSSGW